MRAVVYRGFKRETEVPVTLTVTDAKNGFAWIDCIECEGGGKFLYHPEGGPLWDCRECKGTGRIAVSC